MEKQIFQIRLLAVLFFTALVFFSCEQEEIIQEARELSNKRFFLTDKNFSDFENALLINAEKVVPDSIENKWLSIYGKPDYKKREILYIGKDDGFLLLPLCKIETPNSLLIIAFQEEKVKCKIITYNELKSPNKRNGLFILFLKLYPEKFPNYLLKEKKQESIQTKGYYLIEYCWEVWTGTAGKMEYSYTMCRTEMISVMTDWNDYGGGGGGGGGNGDYDNGSSGGGGGGSSVSTTEDIRKEPCNEWKEMVKEKDQRQRARNAIKCLLGMKAYPYIQFDSNGVLDVGKLEQAQSIMHASDVNQTNQDLYDALLFVAKRPRVVVARVDGLLSLKVNGVKQNVSIKQIEKYYNNNHPNNPMNYEGFTMKQGEIYTDERNGITYEYLSTVYQCSASENRLQRQAVVLGHELLGHMYKYLSAQHYTHPKDKNNILQEEKLFERYIEKIERQIRYNSREIKKAMKILPDCK